jgi:hypothetical protein
VLGSQCQITGMDPLSLSLRLHCLSLESLCFAWTVRLKGEDSSHILH